ncbi:ABC-type sugar transport system permease subunit [Pedobacter cryoconitis]|uniref:ABC-type sugar transport system permease subunit n=1 Tax=Pedobacter cryoconitis TaxID=188932 RepID=A0A7W8ZP82_9SPHI|nr:type VI secretion system TssO [Pedobacter cryoconitis]MBB5637646.1 ABC-type sugar transport system permease subunit [Pedobacter cryoconitis]
MKPINAQELNKSYRLFILNFIFLTIFAVLCVYLFFAASRFEYQLLEKEVKQTDQLLAKRKDINTKFDMILLRFKQLSKYTSINSEEMNNQAIMLEDIQNTNFKIKEVIKKEKSAVSSFLLYKKMTDDVSQMAAIQDSLFTTRFQIDNLKTQLDNCFKTNSNAAKKIRGGRFNR